MSWTISISNVKQKVYASVKPLFETFFWVKSLGLFDFEIPKSALVSDSN